MGAKPLPVMTPLHELLSRIRWDHEFGKGRFVFGYEDHIGHRIVQLDVHDLALDPDNPYLFDVYDEEGAMHSIPFHRVKQVFRDGILIWQRRH
ncbi:MAG TPA: DUF504 domain-containing protein [Rhodocyclaceae bacterium]|nr:DUF504 domain-containing protein [Rhodocyclaceae bacterium]